MNVGVTVRTRLLLQDDVSITDIVAIAVDIATLDVVWTVLASGRV